ncbi:MAG: ABC transporter ATP-binding protein [Lachnospiraceae bacterium]|jgi:ABC-type multidrug transport system fused ATPase/permease subunit|nr:ABC transporter ATP-binding protein [Lachnospiraceae bacterium]
MELGQSKFKKNLSNTIIRSYFQSNPMEVAPLHSSYFIDILQSDVGKTSEFGSWRTVVFVQALMSGVIAASSFALINWKILIILLSIGAVPLLFDITYAKKNRIMIEKARELYDEKSANTLDIFEHYIILRIYNAMEEKKSKLLTQHKEMGDIHKKVYLNNNRVNFIHSLVYEGLFRVVILIGGLYSYSTGNISIGSIAFMLSMSEGLAFFLRDFGSYIRNIQELIVSKNKIEDCINCTLQSSLPFRNIDHTVKSLTLENVSFHYPDKSNYLFKNVHYLFKGGHHYILVGENGLGKSTLFKLIFGLYKPTKGKICINSSSINSFESKKLSYVPQEPKVFSGTLKENLTSDSLCEDIRKVEKILKIVGLNDISIENNVVSENGNNFSKGQLMVIVLCRALLQNPDVLLLDELDANIDEKTLNIIMEIIFKDYPKCCIIAISHNKNYNIYKNFKVISIKDGMLKELK